MRFISLLLMVTMLAPDLAHAAQGVSCNNVAIESAKETLSQQLELNLDHRKDRKIEKKIQKLNFDKNFSENDIRLLLRSLFDKKLGPEVSFYKTVLKSRERADDQRITRLLAEEVAAEGLIKFFVDYDQIASHDRLRTLWFRIVNNRKTQLAVFVLSLFRMRAPVPMPYIPQLLPFRPTEDQLQTLLFYGKDSEQGKAVLEDLAPKFAHDNRRVLFVRALNSVALTIAIIMWLSIENKQLNATSAANGEVFVKDVAYKIDKISADSSSVTDTENDHLYDIVAKKLEAKHGGLNEPDRAELCLQISAPNRCR